MIEIVDDLRKNLTEKDCDQIAEILLKRKEGSVDGAFVRNVIESNGFASAESVEGRIKRIAKYYLPLIRMHQLVIERMISENTQLDTQHFDTSIKWAWNQMADHINELSRCSWYA